MDTTGLDQGRGRRRPRVAVLFGGRSGEHSISCVTAAGVLEAIDRSRYDVVAVGITAEGRWLLVDDDAQVWQMTGGALPVVSDAAAVRVGGEPAEVVPGLRVGESTLYLRSGVAAAERIDVVLPLLHGPYGEDGTVQGLLELAGIRYVGAGVLASAVSMDKHVMKTLLRAAGLCVADWVSFTEQAWRAARPELSRRIGELGWPVFVKPARAGSSLGVSRVKDDAGLDEAILAAVAQDPRIIVEAGVSGREVECGVLDGLAGAPAEASVCGEIVLLGGREFYDFEAKYLDDGMAVRLDCPADLPAAVADEVRRVALRAFEVLRCEGLARVDVFVAPDGEVVVNEVNTMPGFTPISMYPRMWQASGVGYADLLDRLLQLALQRTAGLR